MVQKLANIQIIHMTKKKNYRNYDKKFLGWGPREPLGRLVSSST